MSKPLQKLVAFTCLAVLAMIGYLGAELYSKHAAASELADRRAACLVVVEQYVIWTADKSKPPPTMDSDEISARCFATKLVSDADVAEIAQQLEITE